MAVRYVKNFEFPSKAGYTKSATKVTGQMYAKGGMAKKACYAEGSDASDFTAQAADGYDRARLAQMAGDAGAVTDAERIMSGRSSGAVTDSEARAMANARASGRGKEASSRKKGSPFIPGSNIPHSAIRNQAEQAASEAGSGAISDAERRAMGPQYRAKGGKVAKVMTEFKEGKLHSGSKEGPKVKSRKQAVAIALSEAAKSKKGYAEGGAKKPAPITPEEKEEIVRRDQARGVKVMLGTQAKAKGGMAKHDDAAMDRKLVKQMVKPAALKKAMGGPAAAPQSPLQRMAMGPAAPAMGRAKGVPVAPRAPMIAPPSMGQRGVGVNAKRPGGPDVGMIRNMMAKAATAARPEASPSMMKKGGKVK